MKLSRIAFVSLLAALPAGAQQNQGNLLLAVQQQRNQAMDVLAQCGAQAAELQQQVEALKKQLEEAKK